jgi:hypothetical protein
MINWIFNLLKNYLGHWLLKEEEAEERKKDQERARKQKEIVESDYDTTQTADDLDSGKF